MTDQNGFMKFRIRPVLWKAALWITAGFLVATGFDWTTPKQKFAVLNKRIDTTNTRLGRVEERQDRTDQNFGIVFKLACIDRRYTARDMQLVGLNCPAILNPSPAMQAGQPRSLTP